MRIAIKINKTSITAWVVIFLFISCDSNGVFDQYTSLPSQTWNLKNPVVFEFQIKDTIPATYTLTLETTTIMNLVIYF